MLKMIYHQELHFLHSSISEKIRYSLLCLMTNSCWCDCCFQHAQLWWIYLWLNQKKNEAIAARLLEGHKSIREQMAHSHLERTMTDFRQQWSLRPETFWKTTEGMQQHDRDLFLNLQHFYYDLVLTPIVLLWFIRSVIRIFSAHFLHVTKTSRKPSIRSCSLSARVF